MVKPLLAPADEMVVPEPFADQISLPFLMNLLFVGLVDPRRGQLHAGISHYSPGDKGLFR